MIASSDWDTEARNCLDRLRRGHDLGLDSGRSEEQVDDRAVGVLACEREPDGRQALRDVLFDRGDDTPATCLEIADETLSVAIVGNEHRKIGIPRQTRLGAD